MVLGRIKLYLNMAAMAAQLGLHQVRGVIAEAGHALEDPCAALIVTEQPVCCL